MQDKIEAIPILTMTMDPAAATPSQRKAAYAAVPLAAHPPCHPLSCPSSTKCPSPPASSAAYYGWWTSCLFASGPAPLTRSGHDKIWERPAWNSVKHLLCIGKQNLHKHNFLGLNREREREEEENHYEEKILGTYIKNHAIPAVAPVERLGKRDQLEVSFPLQDLRSEPKLFVSPGWWHPPWTRRGRSERDRKGTK
jgi:hypothetical protein